MIWRDRFNFSRSIFVVATVCVLIAIPGCISFSTFNSPQTTPDGQGSFGAGTLLFLGVEDTDTENGEEGQSDVEFYPEAFGRIGLADRWDVGVKLSPFLLFADVKYQLVDANVAVAADLGASTGGAFGTGTSAVYPAVFVGTDRFYVGGRLTFMSGTVELFSEEATYSGTLPSVMAGASVGNKLRIMPEVNVYLDDFQVLPGLGIQYRFGSNE